MNIFRRIVVSLAMFAACVWTVPAASAPPSPAPDSALQAVLDYVQGQNTTGFLIVQNDRVVVERNWPAPGDRLFRAAFAYETNARGELLEDVASQQKSFVSLLVAVAVDKGLLDVSRSVSDYIGPGWSKATPEQEAKIRVINLLNMDSGLTEQFAYAALSGTSFFYNTPVYAVTKRVLAAAAHEPVETLTHDWLTGPAGMTDTAWRKRPAALGDVGNPTGLVTSPTDTARFGQIVLDGGKAADGRRIVSEAGLKAMFERAPTNPSYGRLWWLNGGAFAVRPLARRTEGPLIPSAPSDLVAALGALDRKLYVSPSRRLIIVRMGAAVSDKAFDETLWRKLSQVPGLTH